MGIGSISFKKAAGSFISGFGDSFVPGLGTAVSGAVGLGEDELNAQYQAELNEKAANKQFARSLEMWNLQNAYNDPAAQMERLQKAGLNPNLVYGGGNVTGNTSGSAPSYELAGTKYNDTSLQREQLALALKEHQQRITNQAIENDLARQRLVLSEREADRSDALAKAQIQAYRANLGLTLARTDATVDPVGTVVDGVGRVVNRYAQPVKDFAGKVVDWAIPTHKPGTARPKVSHFGRKL